MAAVEDLEVDVQSGHEYDHENSQHAGQNGFSGVQPSANSSTGDQPAVDPYKQRHSVLKRKCEEVQLTNERLVNRLHHVKRIIRRLKRERRFLTKKLDDHGDDYKAALLSLPEEVSVGYQYQPPPNYQLFQQGTMGDLQSYPGSMGPHMAPSMAPGLLPFPGSATITLQASGKKKHKQVKTKSEKEKDPNAPKKPANAFFMFCQQRRSQVQETYYKEHKEEIGHHELTKRLAKSWNSLSSEDKKRYYDMYEKDKERYEREMREYTSNPNPSATSTVTSAHGGEEVKVKKEDVDSGESLHIDVESSGDSVSVGQSCEPIVSTNQFSLTMPSQLTEEDT
ncbi:PREDICTED: FACT complex subunit SSRP1-like isoform X1 [Branchiostoma belcheri]|uniref:FACT complex subunit SSRP1-like isoform X1 n=1 Tax=Branchiostoma belcheri TaxID=7741 RepID=A0A6P4ZLG7_BRABE|nr:PREDICTED: FACT complex subunit SSRP1-like isoform X1 [Branchiostoma belcheri]